MAGPLNVGNPMVCAAEADECGMSSRLVIRVVANANVKGLRRMRAGDDIASPPGD
jgi:hypothetical protein